MPGEGRGTLRAGDLASHAESTQQLWAVGTLPRVCPGGLPPSLARRFVSTVVVLAVASAPPCGGKQMM